jgi:predicted DsbA family dithiol-disulfide isomerase
MGAEAARAGVTGIPTFIIGRRRVVGCQPYQLLAAEAEAAGAERRR